VQQYLANLGFSNVSMESEVSTGFDQKADLVIFDEEKPLVVVEFKSAESFPESNESVLRFHPFVRQLQSYATVLKAPYYLLSNGSSYLWFETDESGRPNLLREPVVPPEKSAKTVPPVRPDKHDLIKAFRRIKDLFHRRSLFDPSNRDASLLILAKLLSERGDENLRRSLISGEVSRFDPWYVTALNVSTKSLLDPHAFEDAFDILDPINFRDASPQNLLSALDESFISTQKGGEFRISRWLADLLVRLAEFRRDSVLLDISSSYGDVMAAAWLLPIESQPASVWGISGSPEGAVWAQIQQLAFGKPSQAVFEGNPALHDAQDLQKLPPPSHIVTAPSFGMRITQTDQSFWPLTKRPRHAEDLYLELAVRWLRPSGRIVMLVPEGMLFSANRRGTRRLLIDRTHVTALISLPVGALLPYSNIKTTVMVLDKFPNEGGDHIFMSSIEEVALSDTFHSSEIPQIERTLTAFQNWTTRRSEPSDESWLTRTKHVDINNLTVNYYRPSERQIHKETYQIVQLKQVTTLRKRGTGIKLNDQGTIPVIGPASIRPMTLDLNRFDTTSEEQLPSTIRRAKADDVVINNIGTHLGEAAVVGADAEGNLLSRHVILIRPNRAVVTSDYLAAALNSSYVKTQIDQRATGSVMPALSIERLETVEIPLPDLKTQKRIVEQIKQAKQSLAKAESELKQAELNWSDAFERMFD